MKRYSKILAVIMAITMVIGAFAFVGCQNPDDNSKSNLDPQIQAVYDSYVAYAQENGKEVKSYEDWLNELLESAKGDKGDKGESAYDIWKAANPESKLTEEQWLESLKGKDGENGQRGNKITKGEGDPTETDGAIVGDMYLDTTTWNVWFFEEVEGNGTWTNLGSLTGEVAPTGLTIKDGEPYEYDTQKEAGVYIITVELETELEPGIDFNATYKKKKVTQAIRSVKSHLIKSKNRSTRDKIVYYGFFEITQDNDGSIINLNADGGDITISGGEAAIKIEDWNVKFEPNQAYEIPVCDANDGTQIYVNFDIEKFTNNSMYYFYAYKESDLIGDTVSNRLNPLGNSLGKITVFNESTTLTAQMFIYKTTYESIEFFNANRADAGIVPLIIMFQPK